MKEPLSHQLSTTLLRMVAAISARLGRKKRLAMGRALGRALMLLSGRRADITRENLALAFPEKGRQWLEHTSRAAYANLGITLAELAAFPAMNEQTVRAYVEFRNLHLIENAHAAGKGLILLSAHFGNWELLAYCLPYFCKVPVSVIVKNQRNRSSDALLNRIRTRTGNRIVPMGEAAREIVNVLRRGEALALLADQSAGAKGGLFLPFFGRPASIYKAPAALALRFGAPIIMGLAERRADGSYCVDLQTVPSDDLHNTPEGVQELTRRHTAMLEAAIRRQPHLWAWQHRRWKHKPPVEADPDERARSLPTF